MWRFLPSRVHAKGSDALNVPETGMSPRPQVDAELHRLESEARMAKAGKLYSLPKKVRPSPGVWGVSCSQTRPFLELVQKKKVQAVDMTDLVGPKGARAPGILMHRQTVEGHRDSIVSICYNSRLKSFVTSDNATLRMWTLRDGEVRKFVLPR